MKEILEKEEQEVAHLRKELEEKTRNWRELQKWDTNLERKIESLKVNLPKFYSCAVI